MNINNMHSMTLYNNIHYDTLASQRSFNNYAQSLSKSISNNNESNNNVND